MINEKMLSLGSRRSIIREIFEYCKSRAAVIGAENVYDFSIGNPSVAPPAEVNEAAVRLLTTEPSVALHGYTSAQGDLSVRSAVAESIKSRFGTDITPNHIYMTCGAAASLTITLKALLCEGEECVLFAPFFTEYRVFVENAGGRPVVSLPVPRTFQIDPCDLEARITEKTAAVILNSPNNPSGVVYTEETICAVCEVLERKQRELGHPIYLIADEPYRELVYDDIAVPYVTKYYDDTLVCYSFSKSLSLPGERIGYVLVSPTAKEHDAVYAAICGAGRALGYVCAPSLFQKLLPHCLGMVSDLATYKLNRDLLYEGLSSSGFTLKKPDGAFYLFMKSPEADANAFCERAKKYELLLVPGDDFACSGYVRIAYCVTTEQIRRSLPAFAALAKEYGL